MTNIEYLKKVKSRLISQSEAIGQLANRFVIGTAGSLVMLCPKCGMEHFRDPFLVLNSSQPNKEYCIYGCGELCLIKKEEKCVLKV